MRIGFIRGNEKLQTAENDNIGGHVLSGGAILAPTYEKREFMMRNTQGVEHFGNDYHIYSLLWTPKVISVAVDNMTYAIFIGNIKNKAERENIPSARNWDGNSDLSPFDKNFYISLGLGVGGIGDFPDNCVTGEARKLKPWSNTSPKAELNFWEQKNNWYPTWVSNDNAMKIDYVKVWAL